MAKSAVAARKKRARKASKEQRDNPNYWNSKKGSEKGFKPRWQRFSKSDKP